METVGRPARPGGYLEASGFLLARMKAVPSGQTSVKQGQKLIRSQMGDAQNVGLHIGNSN